MLETSEQIQHARDPKRVQDPTKHEDNYSANDDAILLTTIILSM